MRTLFYLMGLSLIFFVSSCGDTKKDRAIDVDEKSEELYIKEPLEDKEVVDRFIGIPVFESGNLVDEEISDGDDLDLVVRTYQVQNAKPDAIFEFYKNKLPESGWKIDESRTSKSDYAIFSIKENKQLNVGIEKDEAGEIKFFLTMVMPKE